MDRVGIKRESRLRELIDYFRNRTAFLGEYDPAGDKFNIPHYTSNVLEFQELIRPLFPQGSEFRQRVEKLKVDPANFVSLQDIQCSLNFLMLKVEEKLDSVVIAMPAVPSQSLKHFLLSKNIPPVNQELGRCVENVESDPSAAITAASSLVESILKVYIEEYGLEMRKKQTIRNLWKTVSRHAGLSSSPELEDDLNMILTGLASLVNGIGNLRTHAGSAHGRGRDEQEVEPRHARLAVHAANTLVVFLLETWDRQIT